MSTFDSLGPGTDLSEALRLHSSYAGTVHWVSTFCGPALPNGRDRTRVQISDVIGFIDLDLEEAKSLHLWLSVLISRKQ